MKHIMDHVGIYVNENKERFAYKRIIGSEGLPNYYPPPSKSKFNQDMYIDEILFLPIELEIFNSDRKNKFFAFRYFFNSSGHQTLSLGPDATKLGITTMQLTCEVTRVRYFIKDKLDIVIDKTYDPLYPPRVFNIQAAASEIGSQVQHITDSMINLWNNWYLNHNV